MTEEPTLADYDEDEEFESEGGSDRPPSEGVGSRAETDPGPEPAESTYGWGEYDCARCGSATDRIWRAEGDLVCPDCKEW